MNLQTYYFRILLVTVICIVVEPMTLCTQAGAQSRELTFSVNTAIVTNDAGTKGNVKHGNLPDAGDEYCWTLSDIEKAVYEIELEVRTGDRGEGTGFVNGYRMSVPSTAFPKGAVPHDLSFSLDSKFPLKIVGSGPGYKVFRGRIVTNEKALLRPGDQLRVRFTGSWGMVWNLILRPVNDDEKFGLSLRTGKFVNLFTTSDEIGIQAQVTNWRSSVQKWHIAYRVLGESNENVDSGGSDVEIQPFTSVSRKLILKFSRKGPFHIQAELLDGEKHLTSAGLSFGVVPDIDLKKVSSNSPFGIHKGSLDPWPPIGAKWVRLWDTGDTWNRYERVKGHINWEILDKKVTDAERNGVNILYVFAYTPTWASARPKEPHYTGGGARAEPKDINDWRGFVRAVVSRYKGRINHFEIWNEPNAGFFSGTVDAYVKLLRAAYEEAKAANPECVILGISGTGGYLGWMEQAFKSGALKYMDAVSVHTYTTPSSPEEANVLGRYAATRRLIEKYGGNQPIWNTETGVWVPERKGGKPLTPEQIVERAPEGIAPNWKVGWPYRPVDEFTASEQLVSHYILAMASGVKHLFWYSWVAQMFPMYTVDGAPRMHTIAYAAMAAMLDGAKYVKRLNIGAVDIHAHVFQKPGALVAVLWCTKRTQREVAFQARSKNARIADLWGNTRPLAVTNGEINIVLSTRQVYLMGLTMKELDTMRLVSPVTASESVGVKCPRAAAPISLKEEISFKDRSGTWPPQKHLLINRREQVVIGVADRFASTQETDSWKGEKDLSGVVRTAWDEEHFYLRVDVTDDVIVAPAKTQGPWNGDCVEIFLDMRRSGDIGSPVLDDGVYQIFCVPPAKSQGQRSLLKGKVPAGTEAVVFRSKQGYSVIVIFRWQAFPNIKPKLGVAFGFDIAIDDADNAGAKNAKRKAQIVWHGTANNFQDPSAYGKLILADR